jgi:hypothetical protein
MKIKLETIVDVDEDWISYLTKHGDIFQSQYCGYWMFGMEKSKTGWLCFEHNDDFVSDLIINPEYKAIVDAWKAGSKLPDRWYRLDKDAAIKAYLEAYKRYGENWYHNADNVKYDVAIQLALLGEVKYG